MEQSLREEYRKEFQKMTPEALVDQILSDGEHVTRLENRMNIAAQILDGYGTSVEEVLSKQESKENGET